MNQRDYYRERIRERLAHIEEEQKLREQLPLSLRVSYGRFSGMFVGRYFDEEGNPVYVEGDTREEVEAIVASKLEL